MGNYFFLAIGQGHDRNIGLFELPFPGNPNYFSYIYATEIEDDEYDDPRSIGVNYALFTLIMKKSSKPNFPHPVTMEKYFVDVIKEYPNLKSFKVTKNEVPWHLRILHKIQPQK